MKRTLKNQKGFTLIEIIAVLIILGILAAVAIPRYMDLQDSSRVKAAEAAVAEVKARYSLAYGKYLLDHNGANPTACTDILSDANAVINIGDFTVAVSGTDTSTVTITVSAVDTVALATAVTDTWTIPTQG